MNTPLTASDPFRSHVFPLSKPKRKPKPKARTVESNIVEVDSGNRRDGLRINDSPVPCSDASPFLHTSASTSLAAADASNPQTHHTIGPPTGTSHKRTKDALIDMTGDFNGSSVRQELEGFNGNSQG